MLCLNIDGLEKFCSCWLQMYNKPKVLLICTQVGANTSLWDTNASSLAHKYKTKVEMTDSDKHQSLMHYLFVLKTAKSVEFGK